MTEHDDSPILPIIGQIDQMLHDLQAMRQRLEVINFEALGKGHGLSPQELRVFRYLRNTRLKIREVAELMNLSQNTVKTHQQRVYQKCRVHYRYQLQNLPSW